MKKIYRLFCVLVLSMLMKGLPAAAQGTTVFIDTFDGEFFPDPFGAAGGDPTVFYNHDLSDFFFCGVQVGSFDPVTGTPFDPGHLTAFTNSAGLLDGEWASTAATLDYSAPFTPVLSSLPGIITWEFNMRTSVESNGDFASFSNETVVVLAGSSPFFLDDGVGYAVTYTQAPPYSIKLIRYTTGLYGSLPVTILENDAVSLTSGTNYASVRVTFDPASSKWTLYLRDDGPFDFASPFSGVTTLVGSTTDLTFTGGFPALTHFGFFTYNSFAFFDVDFAEFDNFRVRVDCGIPLFTGSDSVCVGSTATLASSIPGGTWSSLATTIATVDATSGVVTGVAPGTAIIRYTTIPGCFRDTVMRVRALPAPITGPTSLCVGSTGTLASTSTDGVWTSSDGSIASIVSSTGVVTGASVGTVIIQYTNPLTRCATSSSLTVNPIPEPITGPGTVCLGRTITLSTTSTGGAWSSSNAFIASVGATTGIVTGNLAGTATISYTAAGCSRTTVVTVNANPAITGNNIVCMGSTVTLTGTPAGGTWASSNTGIATISAAGVVTSVAIGTTTITYTNATTGCFSTRTQSVNPVPGGITGVSVVCQGSTTNLFNATPGGTWSTSNTAIATISGTGVLSGVSGGTVTVTYTVAGCSSTRTATVNPLPNAFTGSASVCLGSTSTLASTTPGGTWSSSAPGFATVSSTGVVTGVSLGTSTVSYTLSTGCARTIVVSVNPLPDPITGSLLVCAGSTTTLENSTPGGTWASSNIVVANVASATGVVTGVNGGTATITYSSPTTCPITAVVTVNPQPANINGAASVCVGGTATVTNATAGGTWSSTNTAVATISATGVITGVAAGTTVISYTLATGCARTRVFTVNPVPDAITGATSVCVGNTTTLATTSTGGNWISSTPAIASIGMGTGVLTGNANGTATISYIFPTGCFTSRVQTVNLTPTSTITPLGDTFLCPGDFVALTANTGIGFTYQWFSGTTPIPGAVSSTFITGTSGSYSVRVSSGSGCNTTSIPMSVTVNSVTATITAVSGSFSACAGGGVMLDAGTGTGLTYQWQLGSSAIAGATNSTYNATASGDYSVIITNTTGCSGSASATVTINPAPAGTVTLSGPLSFCTGSSVTLTAGAGTGITYQWNNAAGPIAGATGISFTATASGSYYVEETNSFGCTAVSPVSVVVVNPLPSAAILASGPTIFCTGGNVTLNASAAAGLSYQWYRGGIAIAGATDAAFVASTTGAYKVRVTDIATGCNATTATETLVTAVSSATVVPLTPASYCWGGSSTLATNVTGPGAAGVAYQWYRNGVAIAGATGSTHVATMPGNYSVDISMPGSCTHTSATVPVTEKPLPNPLVSYNSTTGVLSTQTHFVTYQWYKNLAVIPGAVTASTVATGNGVYKVQVTDTNGCQSFSANFPLTTFGGGITSVNNVAGGEINVYPNPAADKLFVESAGEVKAVLCSIDGKELMQQLGSNMQLDIRTLADGVYMLRIYNGSDLVKVEKVVKTAH